MDVFLHELVREIRVAGQGVVDAGNHQPFFHTQ